MQMMSTIQQYQQRALSPQEHVPYGQLTSCVYGQSGAIKREPFIGFKILLRDPKGIPVTEMRLNEINHYLRQLLIGTGCVIRETDSKIMPDGYWLITLPRPRSQIMVALNSINSMIIALNQYLGFVKHEIGTIEINVSGACHEGYEQTKLQTLVIPPRYQNMIISPERSVYKFGTIERINRDYVIFRTRWNVPFEASLQEDIIILTQFISAMF